MEFKLEILRPGRLLLLNKSGMMWLVMVEEEIPKKEFTSTSYKFSILATNIVNGFDVIHFDQYDFVAGLIKVSKVKRGDLLLYIDLPHKFPLWDEFFRR